MPSSIVSDVLSPRVAAVFALAHGSWAIVRGRGRKVTARTFAPTPRCRDPEHRADMAFARLELRRGWAVLVDPGGRIVNRIFA